MIVAKAAKCSTGRGGKIETTCNRRNFCESGVAGGFPSITN